MNKSLAVSQALSNMSFSVLSSFEGWDKSRFEAYAKLLRLKNGGQIEEASDSNSTEIADEQMEISDLNSPDSVNVEPLSQFNETKLKISFLDRLTEIIANEKGGLHVSASLMVEWPDRVDVLVAKNTGFRENDPSIQLLATIASSLRDISKLDRRDLNAIYARQELWALLIRSYEPRIKVYISEVRQAFKKTKVTSHAPADAASALHGGQSALLPRLVDFRALISDVPHLSTQSGLEEAVQSAYDICYLHNEQEFESIASRASDARTLRSALQFLSRLKTCFKTLIRGAERLSNFHSLRIIPVIFLPARGGKVRKGDPTGDWSVAMTFSSLGLSLDNKTVRSVFGNGKKRGSWTKSKLLLKFDRLKSSASQVHAEVQVALAASRNEYKGASTFKYGRFLTRGCHGKIYDLWTLPQVPWLVEEERRRLVQILGDIEKDMRNSILNKKAITIPLAQESSIGGSSHATIRPHFDNAYTMSLVSQHLQAQRGGTLLGTGEEETVRSSSASLPSEDQNDTTRDQFLHDSMLDQSTGPMRTSILERGECQGCERETYHRCTHCGRDWFCSQRCQDRMSLDHLAKCSARPITTADFLFDDVVKDQFPKDPQTREDFGFSRCSHPREESNLLGLYRGLLLLIPGLEIEPVKLNEWQRKGLLARKTIENFSTLPEASRGAYFPWFLRNQHILDGPISSSSQPDDQVNPLQRALDAAKPFLEPEDRGKDLLELEPPEKGYCFISYALAQDGSSPNPNWAELDLWYDFGFAICTDEHYESSLGALYSELLGGNKRFKDYHESLGLEPSRIADSSTCPFGEFWRAWKNGKIVELFDKYGMGDTLVGDLADRSGVSHLREFMSYPMRKHGLRPSVWRLKHLLALEDNTRWESFPEIQAAVQEYGFTPQLDARAKIELRRFYKQLLQAGDPLEAHRAKEQGELLRYAQSAVGDIGNSVRDVLRKIDSTRG